MTSLSIKYVEIKMVNKFENEIKRNKYLLMRLKYKCEDHSQIKKNKIKLEKLKIKRGVKSLRQMQYLSNKTNTLPIFL